MVNLFDILTLRNPETAVRTDKRGEEDAKLIDLIALDPFANVPAGESERPVVIAGVHVATSGGIEYITRLAELPVEEIETASASHYSYDDVRGFLMRGRGQTLEIPINEIMSVISRIEAIMRE